VHVEARDLLQDLAGNLKHGEVGVITRKRARQLLLDRPQLPWEPHDRAGRIRARQQARDDQSALGDDQLLAGLLVGSVEVPKIVQARVARVIDPDGRKVCHG